MKNERNTQVAWWTPSPAASAAEFLTASDRVADNAPPPPNWRHALATSVCLISATFLCVSLTFTLLRLFAPVPDALLAARAGILADLLAETETGRQSLFATTLLMPLPSLPGLLFGAFANAHTMAFAHLYGIALLIACCTPAFATLLARTVTPALARALAVGFAVVAAGVSAFTGTTDLLPALAFAVVGIRFDRHPAPVLRAVSGTFYGLAALSHVVGLALACARLAIGILLALLRRSDPERRTVAWIQSGQIAYALAVYLFLSGIIMQDPLYPLRRTSWRLTVRAPQPVLASLADDLAGQFPGLAPVVSGPWGYAAADVLAAHNGHHFVDFRANKIPAWDRRTPVVIVPSPGNPLRPLSDTAAGRTVPAPAGGLLLNESHDWQLYLVPARRGI